MTLAVHIPYDELSKHINSEIMLEGSKETWVLESIVGNSITVTDPWHTQERTVSSSSAMTNKVIRDEDLVWAA